MTSFRESGDNLSRPKIREISSPGMIHVLWIVPGRSYITELVRQTVIQLQTQTSNKSFQTELFR
jgi:hypothetical protein